MGSLGCRWAHEGVDTKELMCNFDKINQSSRFIYRVRHSRISDNKFNENQIFNWSYVDEQEA